MRTFRISTGLAVLGFVLSLAPRVSALTIERGSDVGETIIIGMVSPSILVARRAMICFDGPGTWFDRFYDLGGTYGLDYDFIIHGDESDTGETGWDTIRVIQTDGTNPTGYCGTGGAAGTTWNRLQYNGHFLDLDGDGGKDDIFDGGGANDTWMRGGEGDDWLLQQSSIGSARGEDDNDEVFGWSSGSGDVLLGGEGADCLWDSTNTFAAFDCGNDMGDTRHNGNTGTTGCPNSNDYCGLF